MIRTILTIALACGAAFFFVAGTVGVLRFPDTLSRLHAITKADNLGLGLTVSAVMVHSSSLEMSLKLVTIWALAIFTSSHVCLVIAHAVLRSGKDRT